MTASRTASIAALVGGACWLLKFGLIWANGGSNTDGGVVGIAYLVGAVALVVALLAAGYSVVTKAPLWLQAVVSVATLLLGATIFLVIQSGAPGVYTTEGWPRDELGILVTAVLALLAGLVGLLRTRGNGPVERTPPAHGHGSHAAR